MTRREWLLAAAGIVAVPAAPRGQGDAAVVQTVTGPVAAGRLGLTLMHEHVLVDFIGAAGVSPSRYDAGQAFEAVLPHLQHVRSLGCETLVECTPAYLGRDPRLLRRLAEASGLRILTNTGYYGAANDKHLPAHAFTETAAQLASRWTLEWRDGLDGTGIRPAFMKIGVDAAPLSEVDAKLVTAAALTHRETGLPIAAHTTTGAAALEELSILRREHVPPGAFIWVHAQAEKDQSWHVRAAELGSWVEFDGISDDTAERHAALVRHMKDRGLLPRVLVSHDAGWYRVGEPGGGRFRPYDTLFTRFIPALKVAGLGEPDVRQLLIDNPRRALTAAS